MSLISWLWNRKSTSPSERGREPARRSMFAYRTGLEILEDRRQLSFASPVGLAVTQPLAEVAADVNGDNRADLVVLTRNDQVQVMLAKTNGQFAAPVSYNAEGGGQLGGATALAVADITGDGKPEIITAGTPIDAVWGGQATLYARLNDGKGGFAGYLSFPNALTMTQATFLAVNDFDANQKPDIAVASGLGQLEVVLNVGRGPSANDGSFSGKWTSSFDSPSGGPGLAVGDLNHDGRLDVAAADGAVEILMNTGAGFADPQLILFAGSAARVAAGDVNGDLRDDLVTANRDGTVSVLLSNLDGSLATARSFAIGGTPNSIALADFNKDGKLDIVTTGSELDLLLGNGDGTFGAFQKVGPAGKSVAVGDFNGDGYIDVAQIDAVFDQIDVLLNKADWQPSGKKGSR